MAIKIESTGGRGTILDSPITAQAKRLTGAEKPGCMTTALFQMAFMDGENRA